MQRLDFTLFTDVVTKRLLNFEEKQASGLGHMFKVEAGGYSNVWNTYIEAYPEEVNGIYRVNRWYDGNYDRNFLKHVGNVVFVNKDYTIEYLWDIEVEGYYQLVVDALLSITKDKFINGIFYHDKEYGRENNTAEYENEDGTTTSVEYTHFHTVFKNAVENVSNAHHEWAVSKHLLKRACDEIGEDTILLVQGLLDGNKIYRGNEYASLFKSFVEARKDILALSTKLEQDRMLAIYSLGNNAVCRFRNSAFGTLVTDIALKGGDQLDSLLSKYEAMVDPTAYRRNTTTVTSGMVANARETLAVYGVEEAIYRVPFTEQDLDSTNVLFTSKPKETVVAVTDVLAKLAEDTSKSKLPKNKDIGEVNEKQLMEMLMDGVESVELFNSIELKNNLMALTKSKDPSKKLLGWDNQVGWSYVGGYADAIRERVKAAGGEINAQFRVSLSWENKDDLDIRMTTKAHENRPDRSVYFGNRRAYGFCLDVDANSLYSTHTDTPVENIYSVNTALIPRDEDLYIIVSNYQKRNSTPSTQGFTIQVEQNGEIKDYHYSKPVGNKEALVFMKMRFNGTDFDITIVADCKESNGKNRPGKEVWNVQQNVFVPVKYITKSPNTWGEESFRQEHLLFILDGCYPDEAVNGFFNEHLSNDFRPIRKVLEVVSSSTKVEPSVDQLSGIGLNVTDARLSAILKLNKSNGRSEVVKLVF